jgi:hypothetical protein
MRLQDKIIQMLIAIPLTQLIFMWAIISGMIARYIDWRDITCKIKGSWDIRSVDHCPYRNSKLSVTQNVSLSCYSGKFLLG